MRQNLCLVVCVAALSFGCGKSSGWISSYSRGEPVPAYPSAEPASGAFLVVPADQSVFLVEITSRQQGVQTQLAELIAARDALRKAVESVGELTAFQVTDAATFSGTFPPKEKDNRSEPNAALVQVTYKQPKDRLKQTLDFARAVAGIKPPTGALWVLRLHSTGCGISEPEKYRAQLVAKAMEGLQGFKTTDPTRFRISVTGLEKPLVVKQCSPTEFMLSLPYAITLESASEQVPAPKAPSS